jgi:AraC-like DNA-binding protein
MHKLLTSPPLSAAHRSREQEALRVLELLRSVVSVNEGDLAETKSSIKALWRAKIYIERHLADESLDWRSISRAVQVSPRHLARIFELEGITVTRYIWTRRLERCRADLSDPALKHLAIGEIAFRWGFSSSAHFSRSYRIHFGETPTETRYQLMSPCSVAVVNEQDLPDAGAPTAC